MHYLDRNASSRTYRDAHVEVDLAAGKLHVDARSVQLTRKEAALLTALVTNAGDIMNREVLLAVVWGYGPEIRTRTLDVHIRRLRKKLAGYGDQYIETIFGVGYRFQPYREHRINSMTATAGLAVA